MDLKRMVTELLNAGLSQGEIAVELQVEQPTVSRYFNGVTNSCSYEVGERLVALHRRHVNTRRRKAS